MFSEKIHQLVPSCALSSFRLGLSSTKISKNVARACVCVHLGVSCVSDASRGWIILVVPVVVLFLLAYPPPNLLAADNIIDGVHPSPLIAPILLSCLVCRRDIVSSVTISFLFGSCCVTHTHTQSSCLALSVLSWAFLTFLPILCVCSLVLRFTHRHAYHPCARLPRWLTCNSLTPCSQLNGKKKKHKRKSNIFHFSW